MIKIAIWWGIPCKSIIPVCRELAEIPNVKVNFYSINDLSESRKKLGWVVPSLGKMDFKIIDKNDWKEEIIDILSKDFDIHIFNSVYFYKKIRYAVDESIKLGLRIGIISEAPHNPYFGIKRILKNLFTNYITPFRVRRRVRNINFLLSASGNEIIKFTKLGWDENKIYPFGYFPAAEILNSKINSNSMFNLLCTGYLTRNKGHALMIKALRLVKNNGINFNCLITGYGEEQEKLVKLIKDLNLEKEVKLLGVVEESKLNEIKQSTDLFIAPGYEEPWAIRVNEALLAGIPVILSDKIGAAELIKASGAGMVFKSGDINSLSEKINNFLSDPNLLERAKEKALLYREKIEPKTAAKYLYDVVIFSIGKSDQRPGLPPWLN